MKFEALPIAGPVLVGLEAHKDHRGFFARAFCKEEFANRGLHIEVSQCNLCVTHRAGTVRGMHYQNEPFAETKLVRCVRGSIYDVVVDLRRDSATYGKWYGVELSEDNGLMLVVPSGFAHGYQTLQPESTTLYMVTENYNPRAEAGLRYNDPALDIRWPLQVTDVSDKDRAWALLEGHSPK